jgi:hypothetical protein
LRLRLGAAFLTLVAGAAATAQVRPSDVPPLISRSAATAIAGEVSGSSAKRTVEALSLHHRMRGSQGFNAAAALILERLSAYGLKEVEMISLPADGRTFYGTQRSRPAWNAAYAELWEQRQEGGAWRDGTRVASWAEQPISLAQDSVSGQAEAELVDIGAGTADGDYAGKDIRGKLVLTSSQPSAAAPLAFGKHGAAGIVSWAQNQRQAWWGEDESLIRWGHLDTWEHPGFAFMVSPARARDWQERLRRGEAVRLRARVEAGRTPGAYLIPTAVIPGRERGEEIVFSCHLDHPSPGANDNASGCSGILEVARSLTRLIAEGKLPQPRRTLRFIWPSEIEATIALLNARPAFAQRTVATIHLDMVGGNTEITKSILRVEGSPPSLPSAVGDVGFAVARWVNAQTMRFAETGEAAFPLVDPEGDKRALQAKIGGFSDGSDHQIWSEGSWRIPVLYIADWPDRYIHTQRDVPANIDPTKLKRAVFIAAASAWTLANLDRSNLDATMPALRAESLERSLGTLRRAEGLRASGASENEVVNLWRHHFAYEAGVASSLSRFGSVPPAVAAELQAAQRRLRGAFGERVGAVARPPAPAFATVYRRVAALKGPMNGFGYSWFDDRLKQAGLPRPALLARDPMWEGPSFGYEALNLVDGRRSVQAIRDDLAGSVGPAPVEEVAQYLDVLERLGVVARSRP